MPDYLPRRLHQQVPPWQRRWAASRAAADIGFEVFVHQLRARGTAACAQADTMALTTAMMTVLAEETRFIDHGRRLAGDDPIKQRILAENAELLINLASRDIAWRFQP